MHFKHFFSSRFKEFSLLILACLSIFIVNLSLEYKAYLKFKESKHQSLHDVKLLTSSMKSTKKGKQYWVLKLKASDFTFYTRVYKDLNLSLQEDISLRIITSNVGFKDYLSKSFYVPSYDFKISKNTANSNILIDYFLDQHQSQKIKEFYGALFFALSIGAQLRTDVNYYGIAHLVAISGYHIGLIFSLIFFLVAPFYSFLQKRYFPYRNLRLDLSVFIFVLLLAYGLLINFPPSYIRSLVMVFWGFYLLLKNMRILSFVNLFISVCICIALFPYLLFSVGFLFSVLGVFYIFLYLHHFAKFFDIFLNAIFLNIWTFLAMILPVLYFFPLISYQQILAIVLSGIFVIFYPLVLLLHFFGFGFLFDSFLLTFFDFKIYGENLRISFGIFISYILLSLAGIRFAYLALFCVLLNLIPFIYIAI